MTQLFADGFEAGNFSAWTGTTPSAGSATFAVSNEYAHHGTYGAKMSLGGSFQDYVYAYKDLGADQTICYQRFLWKPTAWSSTAGANRSHSICAFSSGTSGGGTKRFYLTVKQDADSNKVFVANYRNGTTLYASADFGSWAVGSVYVIEVFKDKATSGTYQVWINGVSAWSVSADTNSYVVRSVFVGNVAGTGTTGCSSTEYLDCVVDADAYIGPEASSTLQTVTDGLSLSDVLLRHKVLSVSEVIGATDFFPKRNKPCTVAFEVLYLADLALASKNLRVNDAFRANDSLDLPYKVLHALDNVGLSDGFLVYKALMLSDSVFLVELVAAGVGSAGKTRLFLVLGDLAIQLSGN